jgi:hypothetical protein
MHSLTQELQAHYDEVQRQLQVTLDQYGIAQRKLQSITAELEEIRGNYEAVCSLIMQGLSTASLTHPKCTYKSSQVCFHLFNTT